MLGRGREPLVVHDVDHRYRLNRPLDDWPAIDTTGLASLELPAEPPAAASAAVAQLKKAASGKDSEAFERAVCDMLPIFGFEAVHVGGDGSPDGYADAILGELGYRVMVECKLSHGTTIARYSGVPEAAKYREPYRADYCAIFGLSFTKELTFTEELHTHGVAAWSVDDLLRAASFRLDSLQLRDLFQAGFAADGLDRLAWTKVHGPAKRVRVVASLVVEIGLEQQRMAVTVKGASMPRLTPDAALGLVDARLTAAGSTHGVNRDEIDAVFSWLTSPLVDRAVWTDEDHTAIVIRPRVE
jgi:hypothetical protein